MNIKIKACFAFFFFGSLLLASSTVFACFTVVVGKDASVNGSVLVGHDEQNTGNLFVNFRKIPEIKRKTGEVIRLKNGGSIAQVDKTYGFLWSEIPGCTSSDAYLNENGVVIVSDYCPDRMPSFAELEKDGQIKNGGFSYLLRRIVIERSRNAREGVEIAGSLIDKLGYTSNRTFVIADSKEAWLMAVTKGNKWVAQRVPDDQVVLLPNVYTIQDIDVSDTNNFVVSKDLVQYAEKMGWYTPKQNSIFNFADAYSLPRKQLIDPRQFLAQELVTQKKVSRFPDRRLPFSVTPAIKMNVQDVISILRHTNTDNYMPDIYNIAKINGVKTEPENWKWRNICLRRTQEGAVFELNSAYPPSIGAIYWRTSAAPNTSVLLPWYAGITSTPATYYYPGKINDILSVKYHFDPRSYDYSPNYSKTWWVYRKLQAIINMESKSRTAEVRKTWDKFEDKLIKEQPNIQKKALSILKENKSEALDYLTEYCFKVSSKAVKEAKKLIEKYPGFKGNPNDVLDPEAKKVRICLPSGETSPSATD